eukprot:scaffold38069_cov35-Prasinocladus_malaysianus.AAC.2
MSLSPVRTTWPPRPPYNLPVAGYEYEYRLEAADPCEESRASAAALYPAVRLRLSSALVTPEPPRTPISDVYWLALKPCVGGDSWARIVGPPPLAAAGGGD